MRQIDVVIEAILDGRAGGELGSGQMRRIAVASTCAQE